MTKLNYVNNDITHPIGDGQKIIIHVVNDLGVMGAGVAKALYTQWPSVRLKYLRWFKGLPQMGISIINEPEFGLGKNQYMSVDCDTIVCNMVGQQGIGNDGKGLPPIRYEALASCLNDVALKAIYFNASVHLPYLMGCGLAGGDWNKVEKLLENSLCSNSIPVIVYDKFKQRN
jgi:O-acetyl-ADP-ribose deacetylase (regulator of RNase III)